MSGKDMKAQMTKEPLTRVVKRGGVVTEEIIGEPKQEDEDTLLNSLSRGLPKVGTPSGFAKVANAPQAVEEGETYTPDIPELQKGPKSGATGLASFVDSQPIDDEQLDFEDAEDPDAVIASEIKKSKAHADETYGPIVQEAYLKIKHTHKDLPKDWRRYPQIVDAIFSKISRMTELPINVIDQLLVDRGNG